jgi:hypothetical protein
MALSKITNSGIGAIDTLAVDTDTLVVDSTNNRVGVVNASPSTPLDVVGTGQFTNTSAGASATAIKLQNLDNTIGSATSLDFAPYGNGTVTDKIEGGHDGSNKFSLRFHTYSSGLAERMRIDGDGKVHVNQTSDWAGSILSAYAIGGPAISARTNQANGTCLITRHDGGGTAYNVQFYNSTNWVGSIQTTASSTSYVTSSDYRLKTAVNYDWDATTRLKQLRPARFEWIADGDDAVPVDGFLAHEVQDIVPEAISGTKDAMRDEEYEVTPAVLDEDGNVVTPAVMGTRSVPDYQGIDQSKLVPLLVKTIQELEARVALLENA